MEFRASHILVKDKALAQKILEEIKKGKNFSSLAKQYSICSSKAKGGDLGFFKENTMVAPFEREVKRLRVNQISGIVRTQFGFHIIKKTGVK